MITSRMPDRRACNIYIKPNIQWIFSFASHTAEMCLSYMNRLISGFFHYSRIYHIFRSQPLPVPIFRTERSTIVTLRINPICCAMTGSILPCHQRCSRRRTHTLSVKGRKPCSLFGQTFHIRSPIPIIKRLPHRISLFVDNKRQ